MFPALALWLLFFSDSDSLVHNEYLYVLLEIQEIYVHIHPPCIFWKKLLSFCLCSLQVLKFRVISKVFLNSL